MNDNLDEFFETFLANDAKKAQEKEAKIAEEQKKYEAQREAEKQAREKEALDKSFIDALRNNDIAGAKVALKDGADISYLDMGFDGKNEAYNSAPYKAYYRCRDVVSAVRSADMAEFLLKDVMNMENPKHREVAQEMLTEAFFRDEKSSDKFLQIMKDNNISPEKIMQDSVHRASDIVGIYNKLVQAGASSESFDFNHLVNRYYNAKNGFEYSTQYSDVWKDPEPEKATKTKKQLLEIIKSGYPLNPKDQIQYKFIQELAYEQEYEKFSAQDKKLIADLQSNNIDEIRKSLNGGKIPENVVKYMDAVPAEYKRGEFFNYYKNLMYDSNGEPRDIEPYNFANAEKKYIYNATYNSSLDNLIKLTEFKPEGITNAIAQRFYMDFDSPNSESTMAELNTSYQLADKLNKMNSECKNAVSALMAQKIGDKLHHANPDEPGHTIRLLSFTMKLYDASEEEGKNALRMTMLKFRTTGSNEEKRVKADMFKDALKRGDLKDNIQKDETIKAVSSISYTPLSSLNRQLMKHGKEIEGR